jgi:hypothetical protein
MWTNFAHREESAEPRPVDSAIVKLLAHRYGDGLVYLRGSEERNLYAKARGLGLVDRDGYLTPVGRSLLARTGKV